MKNFKKFLSENPDRVNNEVWWGRQDSRTFGYVNNKFFVSKETTNHPDYFIQLLNSKQISKVDFPDGPPTTAHRDNFKYPGRLWVTEKIISFWKFPSKSDFNKLIDDLKKNGIDVDKDWKVDIKKSASYGQAELLPISDYTDKFKSMKITQVNHVMDPVAKNLVKKATGPNSSSQYNKGIKLPKGMSFAEYRALTMKSESASTVAPSSVATGQHPEKLGEPAKRKEDDAKEEIKKKIKKKLKVSDNVG